MFRSKPGQHPADPGNECDKQSRFAFRDPRSHPDLVTVKELLGHASITTTMRYAHTNRGAKKQAVRILEARSDKTVTLPESEKESA